MPITIDAHVRLGELTPRDVVCELYYGFLDPAGDFVERETMIMQTVEARDSEGCYHYQATLDNTDAGNLGITVRVVPYHPLMGNRYSLGLVAWGSR
jgi:starch phosphorylase